MRRVSIFPRLHIYIFDQLKTVACAFIVCSCFPSGWCWISGRWENTPDTSEQQVFKQAAYRRRGMNTHRIIAVRMLGSGSSDLYRNTWYWPTFWPTFRPSKKNKTVQQKRADNRCSPSSPAFHSVHKQIPWIVTSSRATSRAMSRTSWAR